MLLRRAMEKREAGDLRSRFLPMESTYPAIARWIERVEQLPGYDRSYPPHWRDMAHRELSPLAVPASGRGRFRGKLASQPSVRGRPNRVPDRKS